MKKILKLQDHKHTAKIIDHKHTSYRGLFAVMAVFGIALIFVGKTVVADDYVVNARVAAPIPTIAAQINSPTNQTTATSQNVVISGTCPIINPSIVVVLYRGDSMIGSSGCSADGEFSGTYSLVYGTNVITPKIMTITNDFGPDGMPVSIMYPLPIAPTSPTQQTPITTGLRPFQQKSSGAATQASADALQIKTDMPFIIFKQDQSVIWKLTINGGKSPYTIFVDWGDGTKSTYAANSSGEQVLEHYFKKNKNTVVRVSVKDATGKEVYTSVAGVTFRQQPTVAGLTQTNTGWPMSIGTLWLLYAVIVAMIGAFWLGARVQHNIPIAVRNKKTNTHKNK